MSPSCSSSSSGSVLERISNPSDLKTCSREELSTLCDELRIDLIQAVSEIGGHFASSLGVVELTVAIHYCFDTPKDRLVWDIGHQAYIHKMLTGRRQELRSVKQFGGISGFPCRTESEYDTFGVGHAGTGISAAIGMLEASHHEYPEREDRNVVTVIGDGGMTCGMAFEALNHSGHLHRKLIVVLNDNEMSIAPNVGALSRAFSRAVTGRISTSARKQFKSLHERGLIPQTVYKAVDRAEEAAQSFLSTPAMLFTAFGYRYIGPVDGHDVSQLIDVFERAKKQDGPVLIHAITTKGKGYAPAENDPVRFHGVTPFEIESGSFKKPARKVQKSYSQLFGEALVELAKNDQRVVGVTAAMPDGTGLKYLAAEMPDRFFDVGIAEQHAVTFSAGLACEGLRPVCAIYTTFLQRAYDSVIHDVCIQELPVVFALDRAGIVGEDGVAFHGIYDIAFLRTLPNIVLMAPKDECELRDMLFTGVNGIDGPSAIRFPRGEGIGLDVETAPKLLEIGKGELLRTGASSIALVGVGTMAQNCLDAAQLLSEDDGIEVSVVNPRFIKPLDSDLFTSLAKDHQTIITVEDHSLQGGFGSALLEFLSEENLLGETKIIRLGAPDKLIPHGSRAELMRFCGYDTAGIVQAVREAAGARQVRTLRKQGKK